MRKRGVAESTIFGHRFKIVNLFRFLKFEIDEEDLKVAVKEVSAARVTDNKQPTREQIRGMLIQGTPKQKALISFLLCTGARVGEAAQVKLSDIEFDKTPVVVRFPARKTKTAQKRYSFLSSECVQLIKTHVADRDQLRKSAWLFEGEDENKPISKASVWSLIHDLFILAGLVKPKEEKNEVAGAGLGAHEDYHPHVLRDTNLGTAKGAGYPDSYAEFLCGHSTGSKENYYGEEKTAQLWLEKCEPTFCFLTDTNTKEKVETLETKLKQQAATIRAVNERIQAEFTKRLEGVIAYNEQKLKEMQAQAGRQFETRKIESTNEAALEKAISEGFEPVQGLLANGHIYLRRRQLG